MTFHSDELESKRLANRTVFIIPKKSKESKTDQSSYSDARGSLGLNYIKRYTVRTLVNPHTPSSQDLDDIQ